MQSSLLLLILKVMCGQSNPIFFFLSDFLLTSDGRFSTDHYTSVSTYLQCSLQRLWKLEFSVTQIICLPSWSLEALGLVLYLIRTRKVRSRRGHEDP
jgi:hypothetical protein